MDSNPLFFAGPSNPDFALNMGSHDSVYRNLAAYDAITADVVSPGGDLFSQIHVGSSAINATLAGGPAPTINWPAASIANFGFAGVANYGVYVEGNTSLSQTRCDIANTACIFTAVDPTGTGTSPGQITDTQMRCGGFSNVPSGYTGVELGAGVLNTTVSGTAAAGKCGVPPLQLVVLDGTGDPTLSLCNNSNALVAGCTGYQGAFAAGQFYTQPAISFANVVVSGNVLYAVPFLSPASGGPITKLGIDVTGTGATCEVGVYSAVNAQPNMLIADGGTLTGAGAGTLVTTGTFSARVQLAPQTLYFLAVGCSSSATLLGATNNGRALSAPLIGAPNYTGTTTQITVPWTFTPGGLPTLFQSGTITSAAGPIPNVYAGP